MELYIDRDELGRGLARVQNIIERRSTQPILSHVLLHGRDGSLRVTATDNEVAYIGELNANVKSFGELAVDAASLFQVIRSLPEPTVRLRYVENQLEIVSGRSSFRLVAVAAEEYPPLPPFLVQATATLRESDLRRIVEQVAFSVAGEDVRWGLNGAHVEERQVGSERRLRMVATDGHRLACAEAPFQGEVKFATRMLIPRKALAVLRKLVEGDEESISLDFGDGSLQLRRPRETFWFRLLDGEFPDYKAVVPSDHKHAATARRADLAAALKRVSILITDRARPVRFSLSDGEAEVYIRNTDKGEVRETLMVEMDGPGITVGFNPKYLLEILSVVEGDRVVLELASALAPCLVRDPQSDTAFFVVMPMRLD